jgi:2'-5' RNA ligase
MRLFVAIDLPPEVRSAAVDAIARYRSDLERRAPTLDVRWVPPHQLHLTLWFLGEVPDADVGAVRDALAAPLRQPALELTLSGFGVFPPRGRPRVIWMGVAGDGLPAVRHAIGERLAPLGIDPEARPFAAHLTVGRVRPGRDTAARLPAGRETSVSAVSWRAAHATLFESRLSPRGATHEPVLRIPLS